MESMGAKFRRDQEERATKVAESLKYIMRESVKAQTCCEGWDEAIRLLRDALIELNLVPEGIPLKHLPAKDMVKILVNTIKNFRTVVTARGLLGTIQPDSQNIQGGVMVAVEDRVATGHRNSPLRERRESD